MNFAIDNRELVPPFMPVQSRCDGIFGDLMTVCFAGAFAGHLPIVLAHRPPEERLRTVDDVFKLLAHIRSNDIVSAIIYELNEWPPAQRPADHLQTLGRYMVDLANLSPSDFESKVRRILAGRCFGGVRMAIDRLNREDGPVYWRNDVARLIAVLTSLVVEANLRAPMDTKRAQGDNVSMLQELVWRFGELLLHWPAIYGAIQDLSAEHVERYLTNHSARALSAVDD